MNKEELKKRREKLGLSQKSLGKIMGISPSTFCQMEKGKDKIRPVVFLALDTIEGKMICPSCKQLIKAKE